MRADGGASSFSANLFPAERHEDDGISFSLSGRGSSYILATTRRRDGRVAEGGGLLNRYRVEKLYRGFESPSLRQLLFAYY